MDKDNGTQDREIREALEARAEEAEVPEDLAERTIDEARALPDPTLRERFRAWRDARLVTGGRVGGYPKWAYAGAAAALVAGLFVVGTVAVPTDQQTTDEQATSPTAQEEGTAFSARTTRGNAEPQVDRAEETGDALAGGAVAPAPDDAPSQIIEPPFPQAPSEFPPQLIRESDISVEVERFREAWEKAQAVAGRHGGFITNSETSQVDGDLSRGSLTIRVPAENLDKALKDLRELGELTRMSTSGRDVSGQLVDLDARVRSSQAQETQLLELLTRADEIGDILQIRDRLNMVREEVERLQAQKQLLENQVELATIRAEIFEPDAERPDDREPNGNRFSQAWDQAVEVAVTITSGFVIVAGVLAPFAALALIVWAIVAIARRRRA